MPDPAEKQKPFAYSLKSVVDEIAEEVRNTSLIGYRTRYLPEGTNKAVKYAQQISTTYTGSLEIALIDSLKKEGHFPSEGVAYLLATEHPFLSTWSDVEKRHLLDAAIGDEVVQIIGTLEKSLRDEAYRGERYPIDASHHNELVEKIKTFRNRQTRLRQRANPSRDISKK